MMELTLQINCHKVGIIVDRDFGDRILDLARSFHVWVVESEKNKPIIEQFREAQGIQKDVDPLGPGITSFSEIQEETPQEMCARIAPDVDEHHDEFAHEPPWTTILVYGVTLNKKLQTVFTELGATKFVTMQEGFICTREL